MLQRTGEADTITTHYLAALGLYRALYIPNWMYRYFTEASFQRSFQPVPILAGIVQTLLYSDFFYIYYNKYVRLTLTLNDDGHFILWYISMLTLYHRVLKGKKFSLPV